MPSSRQRISNRAAGPLSASSRASQPRSIAIAGAAAGRALRRQQRDQLPRRRRQGVVLERDAVGEAVPRLRRKDVGDPLVAIGLLERESRDAVARPARRKIVLIGRSEPALGRIIVARQRAEIAHARSSRSGRRPAPASARRRGGGRARSRSPASRDCRPRPHNGSWSARDGSGRRSRAGPAQSRARLIAIIANAPLAPGCRSTAASAVARRRAGSCESTGPCAA